MSYSPFSSLFSLLPFSSRCYFLFRFLSRHDRHPSHPDGHSSQGPAAEEKGGGGRRSTASPRARWLARHPLRGLGAPGWRTPSGPGWPARIPGTAPLACIPSRHCRARLYDLLCLKRRAWHPGSFLACFLLLGYCFILHLCPWLSHFISLPFTQPYLQILSHHSPPGCLL